MIQCLVHEIIERKNEVQSIDTIYFGGGTPSILNYSELKAILTTIRDNFENSSTTEITLEANPDDISIKKLREWKLLGINRLSIGLQSFKAFDLSWMNRAHNVEEAENCISLAQQEGFYNLTVDLIYGLPNLTLKEWKNHIQRLIDLKVPHISAYCLTVEKQTALHHLINMGKIEPATEEIQSQQFELLIDLLQKNNYEQYEISNFCLPGHESRHNSSYWKGEHYIGIGPSAHSFNGKERRWNISNNQLYIKKIIADKNYFETEILSPSNQFNELLLIGLRTKYGVSLKKLSLISQISIEFNRKLSDFIENGWIFIENETIFLTPKGKFLADHITSELFIPE